MKCEICGIREAVTSYIEEINNEKIMVLVCNECLKNQEHKEEFRCDVCGKTYGEFLATGNWGCENCYKLFRKETIKLLKRQVKEKKHFIEKIDIGKIEKEKELNYDELTLEELKDLLIIAKRKKEKNKVKLIEEKIKKIEKEERDLFL